MSNFSDFLKATIVVTAAIAASSAQASQRQKEREALSDVSERLEQRLNNLKIAGADTGFFTSDDYKKAEKAFYEFKIDQTKDSAITCGDYISRCEKNQEFFGKR